MKKLTGFLAVALVVIFATSAFAAPLFPDVPEQHWARDAVANLAAKGILEGYPDGTFKGDRAATRWEMAMALQRFLAKMEAEHSKFATKAELEQLRAVVNNLKDELEALGVRVKNLEAKVDEHDKRITELERITFEGDFVTRLVTTSVKNNGRTLNGTGFWENSVGGVNGIFATPGTVAAPGVGFLPGTVSLTNLRPLVNGLGLTAKANLTVKVKVDKDWNAKLRFAAYTSVGNEVLDAYWGVSAPYLTNTFTSTNTLFAATQPMNHQPWTRMVFDQLMMEHKPTGTKIVAGAIDDIHFDDFVVAKIVNPGIDGRDTTVYAPMMKEAKSIVSTWKFAECKDSYLPYYGISAGGGTRFISDMQWEVMYSKLPSFIGGSGAADITPHLIGFNLGWKIKDQYAIKLNFANVSENSTVPVGANYTTVPVTTLLMGNWTNPAGETGVLPMNAGTMGTQVQNSVGLSFNYRFDPSKIRIVLAGAYSIYKPTKASSYDIGGSHFRGGIGWTSQKETVDLDLDFVYTDPYYDAMQLFYPLSGTTGLLGNNVTMMFPNIAYSPFGYQLHDSDMAPNNRTGIRFGGELRWNDGDGRLNLRVGWLQQAKASNYVADVNGFLTGYKPGFIENLYNPLLVVANANSETKKGTDVHLGLGVEHKFSPSPFKANLSYDYYSHKRDSNFAVGTAQNTNNVVDLKDSILKLGLSYAFNDRFTLRGGVDYTAIQGYHALFNPNPAAIFSNTNVIDVAQITPNIGFDYEVGKNTTWSTDFRYYNTNDKLNQDFAGVPSNQYDWTGYQIMTQFKIKF
jgi:hypothetical protein